jgi:hypothetical protein
MMKNPYQIIPIPIGITRNDDRSGEMENEKSILYLDGICSETFKKHTTWQAMFFANKWLEILAILRNTAIF